MANIYKAKAGDKIVLKSGEEMIFVEVKRTRFVAQSLKDDRYYSVPISSFGEIIEAAPEKTLNTSYNDLSPGDLFYIEHKGFACLFKFVKIDSKRNGEKVIIGKNIIDNRESKIDAVLYRGNIKEV